MLRCPSFEARRVGTRNLVRPDTARVVTCGDDKARLTFTRAAQHGIPNAWIKERLAATPLMPIFRSLTAVPELSARHQRTRLGRTGEQATELILLGTAAAPLPVVSRAGISSALIGVGGPASALRKARLLGSSAGIPLYDVPCTDLVFWHAMHSGRCLRGRHRTGAEPPARRGTG